MIVANPIKAFMVPVAAMATQVVTLSPSTATAHDWFWVILASMGGWFCSSFDMLDDWIAGTRKTKMIITRRIGTSLFIGSISYFLVALGGAGELWCFIFAFLNGWAGEAAVNKMLIRYGITGAAPPPCP